MYSEITPNKEFQAACFRKLRGLTEKFAELNTTKVTKVFFN